MAKRTKVKASKPIMIDPDLMTLRRVCVDMALNRAFESDGDFARAYQGGPIGKPGQSVETVLKRADAIFVWITTRA